MESFAYFSYLFHSLPWDPRLFSFTSNQAHLFWLGWHYCLFTICVPYNFHSSHFSTSPNLLPVSSFPPSSSQNSKKKLGPARNSELDSCDPWALHAWAAAEGAGLGDWCGHSNFKKVEAGAKGWGPALFIHLPRLNLRLYGENTVPCTSLRLWATHWQSVPAFCSSGNDGEVVLVGTVLIISDRMGLEIAWAKKKNHSTEMP